MTLRLVAPLLLALLAPLQAPAATVPLGPPALGDWPTPGRAAQARPAEPPILKARMMVRELALLPSGRVVALPVVAAAGRPPSSEPPQSPLVALPLPGAMPLFLGALAGFVILGRRPRRKGQVSSAPPRSRGAPDFPASAT